jgi:isoleucyl-tRNA synthetase
MYTVLSALTRLVAPILCFTAEEIWKAMPHAAAEDGRSVFLNEMPAYDEALVFPEAAKLDELFTLRDDVMKALELARAAKMIGKSLDAKVTVYTTDAAQFAVLNGYADLLDTMFITSQAVAVQGEAPEGAFTETVSGIAVLVENADGEKCDRCWMYTTAPIYDGEGDEKGCLCGRCHKVVFGA